MSDNWHFDITAIGDDALKAALDIAFIPHKSATHYRVIQIEDKPTLVLYWHEDKDTLPLPWSVTQETSFGFVSAWLSQVPRHKKPGHDGGNGEGFRVFVNGWGRVNDTSYGFVGIQFEWAWYGK